MDMKRPANTSDMSVIASDTGTLPSRNFACWFLALFAVTQFPLYWVQYPDITDFPNHLARIHTLIHLSQSGMLQRYYELRDLQIGTNLAMEVIVPGLARWMSLALALKVFASLSTLLLTTGAVIVGRAITGRFSYLLLGVLLFANNAMFQLGLLNYLFGVGVAFWLLSAWIVAGRLRLIAFSAGCVVVYLCHLSALGIYVIGVVGYELSFVRSRSCLPTLFTWRSLVLTLMQFVPAAILHVLVSSNSAGSYIPAPSPYTGMGISIVYKMMLVFLTPGIGVSGYLLAQIAIGLPLVLALYFSFRSGALRLVTPARWMAGLLAIAIAFLPPSGFGSNLVDIRLIPACCLLAWCGLEATERSRWIPGAALAVIASVVFLISLETTYEWGIRDGEYGRVRSALHQVAGGSRIATVTLDHGETTASSISVHAGAWSVIDGSAFLSNFYIWPFQPFWVAYRAPYASLAALARTDDPAAAPPAYETLKNSYDYVLVFGGDSAARLRYAPNAEAIYDSRSLRLLRTGAIDRSGVAGR
ncbi:hypothetical protein [Phyllobacterium bourgognense]|uniref:Dolichyl-phosphate-mannose-protein mannosyltransferase n=1 Tax=Phyllobacterium bourgognense TaxID=314236 RepID=A0A368Z140_9HYPH|nr:hypothetical protein [Phyllobacterium bourgognense]RCW86141.1 hypothetical protein C7476_102119 [Phyllobacterium bourgognense]